VEDAMTGAFILRSFAVPGSGHERLTDSLAFLDRDLLWRTACSVLPTATGAVVPFASPPNRSDDGANPSGRSLSTLRRRIPLSVLALLCYPTVGRLSPQILCCSQPDPLDPRWTKT